MLNISAFEPAAAISGSAKPHSVLVLDQTPESLQVCRRVLEEKYAVTCASENTTALKLLQAMPVDVLIVNSPSRSGVARDVMREALRIKPDVTVLLIAPDAAVDVAVQAVRDGAFDVITGPLSAAKLQCAVERSLTCHRLAELSSRHERRNGHKFERIVAESYQMAEVLDVVRKVAPTTANVLLLGESGTGKELVARCIHDASSRSQGPFVPIDCASLPESLLESELFGYEKGAFTGAIGSRPGLIESANGGTLFLDEIGNLSPNLQAKLLRVLEDRRYRRVGGRTLLEVNARFISATNSHLEEMVRKGTFREDLFYRLNVVGINIPPLRERPDDIGAMAQLFLGQNPDAAKKNIFGFSSAALLAMQGYRWPGNVRELKNVVWRAVSLTESNQITPLDLPAELLVGGPRVPGTGQFRQAKQQAVDEFEAMYLQRLMVEAAGNVSRAALRAGLKRSALHRLLHKHKVESTRFRRH